MGDDLTISGGGSVAVATDEMFANAQKLTELALQAGSMRERLVVIDALVSSTAIAAAGASRGGVRAEVDIDVASSALADVATRAQRLEWILNRAADGYGFVDRTVEQVGSQLAESVAFWAGRFGPALMLANPALTLGVIGTIVAVGPRLFSRQNNGFITNPFTVGVIRNLATAADDGMLGLLGVPPVVARAIGDGGLGLTGLAVAAGTAMKVGSVGGILTETPVRLVSTQQKPGAAPPSGFADRLARVPDTDETGGGQVRIERYEIAGEPDRYEVFVAGTVTFSPVADTEPWDMTSNLANAAGAGSGSYESVAEAMRLAGIDESNPVQITGYSQGGGTAARIAASSEFTVVGLLTFGGPTGNVDLPDNLNAVIVEHVDDVVPALGGTQQNLNAVLVDRDVFAGREIPDTYAVPAHHYEYYEETATLMDRARSDQLTDAVAKLDAFTAGSTAVSSTVYEFERVDD